MSLRAIGAFTVNTCSLVAESFYDSFDNEESLFCILEQEMNKLIELSKIVTADDYYKNILEIEKPNYETDKVIAYICTGQMEQAKELLSKMERGRFGIGGSDFKELAIQYLSQK